MKVIMAKIETITYFNVGDYPEPIRFRIRDKDGKQYVVHIDRINYIDKERRIGNEVIIYECQSVIRNVLRPLQIIYDIEKYSWFLYKI